MKRVILFVISLSLAGLCYAQNIINVPTDQPTIQAGIDAAIDGDVVLVEDGTYYENIKFKGKAITVASLFWDDGNPDHIENTIIDGSQPSNPDSSSTVYFVNGEDTTSHIFGFTIQGGGDPQESSRTNAGIRCKTAGPTIEHNRIINNVLGVMATGNSSKTIIIKYNFIADNQFSSDENEVNGGGIAIASVGRCWILNNVIRDNYIYTYDHWAQGGGIYCFGSEVLIVDNIIDSNIAVTETGNWAPWGGGIYVETEDNSVIKGNKIRNNEIISVNNVKGGGIAVGENEGQLLIDANFIENNTAKQGAGICIGLLDAIVISNNVIRGNTTDSDGGGIYIMEYNAGESSPVIVNNTIVENGPSQNALTGGGISYNYSLPLIAFNNIIYDNSTSSGKEVHLRNISDGYLYNNNLDETKVIGIGTIILEDNILYAPDFADSLCHLTWNNAVIDYGLDSLKIENTTYFSPVSDYDGEPRPQQGQVDIGADESPYDNPNPWISETNLDNSVNISAYPNPVSTRADIRYSISDIRYSKLSIYDAYGRLIETLVDGVQQPGEHVVRWNADKMPVGVYTYRFVAGNEVVSGKIVVQ